VPGAEAGMRVGRWICCVTMVVGGVGCARQGAAPVAAVRAAPVEVRGLAVDVEGNV
jgi:hypothetical protein